MAELERRFPLVATADMHIGSPTDQHFTLGEWEALFAEMGRKGNVITIAGDLTQDGKMNEADAVARMFEQAQVPVLVTLGNHDRRSTNIRKFKAKITEPHNVYLLDDTQYYLYKEGPPEEEAVHGFIGMLGVGGGFGHSTVARGQGYDNTVYLSHMEPHARALGHRIHHSPAAKNTLILHYPPFPSHRVYEQGYNPPPLEDITDQYGDKVERILHGHFHDDKAAHETVGGKEVRNVSKDNLMAAQPDNAPFVVIFSRLSGYERFAYQQPSLVYDRVTA